MIGMESRCHFMASDDPIGCVEHEIKLPYRPRTSEPSLDVAPWVDGGERQEQ